MKNPYSDMDPMYLENEIRACKIVLSESDSQIIAGLEGLLKCTTTSAITNHLKNVTDETKNLLTYRETIRERMEAMQAALDGEEPEEPENFEDAETEDGAEDEATLGEN